MFCDRYSFALRPLAYEHNGVVWFGVIVTSMLYSSSLLIIICLSFKHNNHQGELTLNWLFECLMVEFFLKYFSITGTCSFEASLLNSEVESGALLRLSCVGMLGWSTIQPS